MTDMRKKIARERERARAREKKGEGETERDEWREGGMERGGR